MDKEVKTLIISRNEVFVRFIEVPSMMEAEIGKMAEFQAMKEIPYAKEDLIISYRNISSFKEGFSYLMMVIADKKMIQEKIHEREQKDIKIDSIRLHSELLYLYLLKKEVIARDKVNLVIHIGKEESEIMIVDKTRPIFSRGFKNSERFLEEVDRSVLAYERVKINPSVENIIVVYASDIDIKEARPYINKHFTTPVNFYEYSDDLRYIDLPAKIELLPKEITSRKESAQKKQELIVTCSLVGLIIILSFAFCLFKIEERNRFLKMLDEKSTRIQSKIKNLDVFLKKTEIAKNYGERGEFIIEILKHSYILIPADISLSGLSYNGEDSLFYKGTSRDMSTILGFVKKLEKLKYFNKVEVKYATKKNVKGQEVTDFSVQCQLKL